MSSLHYGKGWYSKLYYLVRKDKESTVYIDFRELESSLFPSGRLSTQGMAILDAVADAVANDSSSNESLKRAGGQVRVTLLHFSSNGYRVQIGSRTIDYGN